MTTHTITAFFDDREHADEAVALLRRAGLSETDVTLSPSDARDEFATFDPLSAGLPRRKGFWGMLEDLFGGSDDHDLYAEGVRRGSTMLTAQVEDERLDDAVEILDRHGSIDLDEREVSWRNDGWLGGSVGMPSGASLAPGALGLETKAAPVIIPPVEPAPVMTPASFRRVVPGRSSGVVVAHRSEQGTRTRYAAPVGRSYDGPPRRRRAAGRRGASRRRQTRGQPRQGPRPQHRDRKPGDPRSPVTG